MSTDGYGGQGPTGPGYGPPAGGGYPVPTQSNGMAIASLVLGIISIIAACFYGTGAILGIVAVVLGVMARKKVKLGQAGQGGLALGGIITGVIGIVIGVVILILLAVGISMFGGKLDEVQACSTLPQDQQQQCLESVAN